MTTDNFHLSQEKLEDTKGVIKIRNRRRIYNTIQWTKGQTTIYKTLQRKL